MRNLQLYLEKLKQEHMISDDLLPYFQFYSFSKGDLIVRQGQQLDILYIFMEGKIKACHTTSNGTVSLIAISNSINVIGEIEFLNHQDVINDIYAIDNCFCLGISIENHENLLLNDLAFIRYLALTMSQKLYNANQNTSISKNYPVENRLASYLIACAENKIIQENFVQVAEMIGCSYRQLQRVLNDFCEKKYIQKI
ncbi:cyclic nucleotide-binding domain-containing protein [Longibaculum muris]|uniref:cyclic nucleotide-binding domain-containing protein n=1 Tax=Longibaculum muris TaxID=1796628 RepID=UPI003AB57270